MYKPTYEDLLENFSHSYREDETIQYLIKRYLERCSDVYEGRNRLVFQMKGYVVKLPTCDGGWGDNEWETSVSNSEEGLAKPNDFIQYPHTRSAEVNGILICFMETVEHVKYHKNLPSWVDFVDCQQVGYTRRGRLVAYDYGRN